MDDTCVIQFTRPVEMISILRSYKVIVDDKLVCRLANGKSNSIEVPSGRHKVFAKIDWCRSKTVELNCPAGGSVEVKVYSPLDGWKVLFALPAIIFPRAWVAISTDQNLNSIEN